MDMQEKIKSCQPCVEPPRMQRMIRIALVFLTWISMMFAYVGACGCQFLIVKSTSDPEEDLIALGFFNAVQYNSDLKKNGCVPYLKEDKEELSSGAFGAGKAFAVMTVMSMTLAFFISIGVSLFVYPEIVEKYKLWRIQQGLLVSSFFTQIFTFSAFAADVCSYIPYFGFDTECSAGASSGLAAWNIFLILFLIVMSCAVPAPPHPVFKMWDDEDGGVYVPKNSSRPTGDIVSVAEEDRSIFKEDVRSGLISVEEEVEEQSKKKKKSSRNRKTEEAPIEEEEKDGEDSYDEDDWVSDVADDDNDEDADTDAGDDRSDVVDITITRENHPKGTKIIKEVTYEDGSKTVTETIEANDDESYMEGDV